MSNKEIENRKTWLPVVKAAAEYYKIDWRLLDALIQQDSSWRTNAISEAGAEGVAQIMPETAKELGIEDSFDPGQNIWGAALYLKRIHSRLDDWKLTIAAYNAGPTRVEKCMCVPNITETKNYVQSIMTRWNQDE